MSRFVVAFGVAAVAAVSLAGAQDAAAQSAGVSAINLPAAITFPEGIAYDAAADVAYTASAVTGAVARVNLKSGASEIIAPAGTLLPAGTPAPFPAVLGMKLDANGRLWISGGATGRMWVLDTKTGKVLKSTQVPNPSASLINDVILVGNAGYFTDTRTPTFWRIEAHGDHITDVEPWLSFANTPLQYDSGANLNGIAATPDGTSIIVVQMGKGLLFRIDVASKAVTAIDTAGEDLSGADGLVLDGHTLYVVRQPVGEIATVTLSNDYAKGTVVHRFKDPSFVYPATAAKVGDHLLVVVTQFNTRGNNSQKTPFTFAHVPLAALAAR
jgi:Cu-Zn family superoxide dismutase